MADIYLRDEKTLECDGKRYVCAIGKGGMAALGAKREGDGKTPRGIYYLRRLFYRTDAWAKKPACELPMVEITADMGWCDAPDHAQYNQLVALPFAASHEKMWRDDGLYDAVVEIGYNDAPVRRGFGSAIFMHIAKPDYAGTEGCVALAREDLLEVLAKLTPHSRIILQPS